MEKCLLLLAQVTQSTRPIGKLLAFWKLLAQGPDCKSRVLALAATHKSLVFYNHHS